MALVFAGMSTPCTHSSSPITLQQPHRNKEHAWSALTSLWNARLEPSPCRRSQFYINFQNDSGAGPRHVCPLVNRSREERQSAAPVWSSTPYLSAFKNALRPTAVQPSNTGLCLGGRDSEACCCTKATWWWWWWMMVMKQWLVRIS